jgi:hypothetical protein
MEAKAARGIVEAPQQRPEHGQRLRRNLPDRRKMLIREIENANYKPVRVRKLQTVLLAKRGRLRRALQGN